MSSILKFCFLLLVLSFTINFSYAINVQQFDRSNSLTYEMIEDTRLQNSHVKNKYRYLFNLGLVYVDSPLVIENQSDSDKVDEIVDGIYSLHFGAAVYLWPDLQVAIASGFSLFENNNDEEIKGFQDIQLKLKYRLINNKFNALTLMPVVTVPLDGGETDIRDSTNQYFGKINLLSDNKVGYGAFIIYEHLFKWFQMSVNLGYKINDGAKFVDVRGVNEIDKTEVLTTGIGFYVPATDNFGFNFEFLRNWATPFSGNDLNPTELFAGVSAGLTQSSVLFVGAGLGNIISGSGGGDFRAVAGLKFTPDFDSFSIEDRVEAGAKKSYVIDDDIKAEVEEVANECSAPDLFNDTSSLTVLFANDSSQLRDSQEQKISDLLSSVSSKFNQLVNVNVVGHTSSIGSNSYNERLGQARANRIVQLLQNNGVPRELIVSSTMSENQLLKDDIDTDSDKYNRRVEILFELKSDLNCR